MKIFSKISRFFNKFSFRMGLSKQDSKNSQAGQVTPLLVGIGLIVFIALLVIGGLYLSRRNKEKEQTAGVTPTITPVVTKTITPGESWQQNGQTEEDGQMTVSVYFGNTRLNPNTQDCSKVYPVARKIPETTAVARSALNELFKGPSAAEKNQGYTSFFSDKTKDILLDVKIEDKTAYVNLRDIRNIIPNASSSCGSAQLMAEIENTLKQFSTIDKVIIAINGSAKTFYEWIGVGCNESNNNCDSKPFGQAGDSLPSTGDDVGLCEDVCGDGVCQEIVCLAEGCPCPETVDTCPADCN